jgi:hypothetical protein
MMEEETLQLIIRHFNELKMDINGVKIYISAVTAGQEELKMEMNAVTPSTLQYIPIVINVFLLVIVCNV